MIQRTEILKKDIVTKLKSQLNIDKYKIKNLDFEIKLKNRFDKTCQEIFAKNL